MKSLNLPMLLYSVVTVLFMLLIGVSIAERSLTGILLSTFAVIFVMGAGFVTKKKLREKSRI